MGLGNDVSKLQRAIEPCKAVLEACRQSRNGSSCIPLIVHTREGHRPELVDVHGHKQRRCKGCIGRPGPRGKILVRGEEGHDIIEELYPKQRTQTQQRMPSSSSTATTEIVIDKPGKGSFYATDLELILAARNIETLLVCGVTTEVCVHTTVREANDRGYHCLVVEDACASYCDDFHETAIRMISAQGGIFGSVTTSSSAVKALEETNSN